MKTMKRMAGVLLALVMALALTVPAFAADETTISAPKDSTRTYAVYQIFTGDLHNGVLSNVKWGKNGTGTKDTSVDQTTLDALTAVNSKSDTEKLAAIKNYVNLESTAIGTVDKDTSLTVPTGYYLIKDNGPVGAEESYSLFVVQVVGPTTISPKTGTTTSEKKVIDKNDSTGETSGLQDSADYDVGDSVPFQLKATLPENVSDYTTYKVVFHDTLSKGLTYNNDAKVYIGGTETNGFTVASTVNANGTTTLTVSCNDVKALGAGNNSVITVEYTATLNENATVGSAGNSNKMYLEYSNNPNKSATGDTGNTGNTPDDTVVVFTYQTIINKVDKDNNPLQGAEFTLEKKILGDNPDTDGEVESEYWKAIAVVKSNNDTTFTFSGLDDGIYRLRETTTPAGYNTIEDIVFTITANHVESLTSLEGTASKNEITFTPDLSAGSLSASVVNKAGALLPETGGIGTTIFYVLGGALMLGAVVLLVTKKRMNAE